MRRVLIVVGVLFTLVIVLAFLGSLSTPSGSKKSGSANLSNASSSVPWQDYSPQVKIRIDDAISAKDCRALQSEFETAHANDAATRSRTGHGNLALMEYLDGAMKRNGCYKAR